MSSRKPAANAVIVSGTVNRGCMRARVRTMTLPPAPPAFRWSREVWGDALRCVPLEAQAQHLFTTKQLQLHTSGSAPWDLVAASAGSSGDHLFRIKQVHGRTVRVVRAADKPVGGGEERPEADAIISDVPGAVLAVQVADCVPMLLADPRTGVAGAVHAGWRGTSAAIAPATIETLRREFNTRPQDVVVALGPSIGACCYEVGVELMDAFRAAGATDPQLARWFSRNGHSLRLDLWQVNYDQLVAAGVSPENIYLSRLCTQTHADTFDSYRAEGSRAGRMVAAIQVPSRRGELTTEN
jgi:YfiH family protein